MCNLDLVTGLPTGSFVLSNQVIANMTVYVRTGYENSILSYFQFRHWSQKTSYQKVILLNIN